MRCGKLHSSADVRKRPGMSASLEASGGSMPEEYIDLNLASEEEIAVEALKKAGATI